MIDGYCSNLSAVVKTYIDHCFISFSWHIGEWSKCSQTCGGGRKTRSVVCKQLINQDEEVILDDTECQTQRPLSERICRRGNCPAMWVAEDWTEVM